MNLFQKDIEHGRHVLKRFALARAALILVVAVPCVVLHVAGDAALDLSTAYLCAVFFIAMVESLVVAAILNTAYKPTARFAAALLTADLVLISAIVLFTGGGRSIFAVLYVAAILSTSVILSFEWSLRIATISSMLFVLVMLVERSTIILPASAFRGLEPPLGIDEMWAYSGMKVLAFYLSAFLSGYLSRQIGLLRSFQHNILNSFSSGFISVDRGRRVTYLNAAGGELLKCSPVQSIGENVSSVFPVPGGESNPLVEAVEDKKECRGKEVLVKRGDGERIPVGITVSPLKDGNEELSGAIASFVDLTEMKRMEEELRRADRLATVGEMSASLAHEIRNPVASIRGAVQELADNLTPDGTNEQLMKIAIRESDQLSRVIAAFLDFVDSNPLRKETFEVGQVLEEAIQAANGHPARSGGVQIQKDFADPVGRVVGERVRIKKVLENLIRNGIEAMPGGGILRVSAEVEDGPAGRVRIRIHDTGFGIPSGEKDKVFNPFYTKKPHGIGLGMAIAHKVITGHGGSIDLDSVEGTGTTVTIALPREA